MTDGASIHTDPIASARILVVDDNPLDRRLLHELLTSKGHVVMECADGETALAAIRQTSPDVILLDIMMPGMDGVDVCRCLKKDAELAGIPVIFLTGLDDKETIVKAFDAGAADVVSKPFYGREVLARVGAHAELQVNRLKMQDYARQLKERLDRTEEDEEAGRQVQFKLLPKKTLRLGPCEFRSLLMPSMRMSGDFVDYFEIDAQRLGFYMLDVSGHGAASAFVTVLIKSSISHALANYRAGSDDSICDPARFLAHLNRELIQDGLDKHAALFYALLERDGREMRYANGGYFPFPILCANGAAQTIACRSLPVGLFDTAAYTTVAMALPEAFALWVFSDGILDILPEEALAAKVARLEELGRAGMTDLADIRRVLKIDDIRELPDDITILTVTRRSP